MNKAKEPWYLDNLNVITALILLVAMLALCCWLAPDQSKKAGACERVTIKTKGVKNETNNR